MKLNMWRDCQTIPVIYGIQNIVTNKWYIGSCHNFRDRVHRHFYNLEHNCHHSNKLQRSWNKYGSDSFEIMILKPLELADVKEMYKIEESFIQLFDSAKNGYNMLDKCYYYKRFQMSAETAKRAGITHSKPVLALDRYTGHIVKRYVSLQEAATDIGSNTSNISQVCKHRHRMCKNFVFVYENEYDPEKDYRVLQHHMKGVHKSDDWKTKARLHNKKALPTYKYDLNGNLIAQYTSRAEAEKQNNLKKEFLRRRLDIPINGFIYTNKIKDIV